MALQAPQKRGDIARAFAKSVFQQAFAIIFPPAFSAFKVDLAEKHGAGDHRDGLDGATGGKSAQKSYGQARGCR